MIRRPPRSTLFPSRRSSDLEMLLGIDALVFDIQDAGVRFYTYITTMGYAMEESAKRSEEHTSELQSRLHLVCRLLLEKKKARVGIRRVVQRRKPMKAGHTKK